jgi:hypothetical protein
MAGVGRTTTQNALREAKRHGLIAVEERRRRWNRNDPNSVTIVSPEWRTWLERGGRVQNVERHDYQNLNPGRFRPSPAPQGARRYEQGARPSSSYANSA